VPTASVLAVVVQVAPERVTVLVCSAVPVALEPL
jgi:hypothetical protein